MFNGGSSSIRFYKRLGVYKNSAGTVCYDPKTKQGRSYAWVFLAPVNGTLVFNEYHWSSTTAKHQSAVRSALKETPGANRVIYGDFGNADVRYISKNATRQLYKQLFKAEVAFECSRVGTHAHARRVFRVRHINENIAKLEALGARFRLSQREKQALRTEAFENEMNRISKMESEKCFKFLSLQRAAADLSKISFSTDSNSEVLS